MSWFVIAAHVVAILLVCVGLVGLLVPGLPGPPLVLIGIVILAWAQGFERIGWLTLVACTVLTVAMVALEQIASVAGVKKFGGSRWGLWGAVLGALVGLFFLPLGLLLGPLVGAVLGEVLSGRPADEAARAGWGAVLGLFAGALLKAVLTLAMVAVATVAYFF